MLVKFNKSTIVTEPHYNALTWLFFFQIAAPFLNYSAYTDTYVPSMLPQGPGQ